MIPSHESGDTHPRILILGCGYVGQHTGKKLADAGHTIYGTVRSTEAAEGLRKSKIKPILISEIKNIFDANELQNITHIIDSIPLEKTNTGLTNPQQSFVPELIKKLPNLKWAGYLSTTGVYGDSGGEWVDEDTPANPTSERGKQRLIAEKTWINNFKNSEIFRISGIYGPGRNLLPTLAKGNYIAIKWDEPHYSNRVHVDDIADALIAAIGNPKPHRIINLADDMPYPHADYVSELCTAAGFQPPILITPDEAKNKLSLSALDFFIDNKRISNKKLHDELLPRLKYPSFRDALPELIKEFKRD
jgi:nucleoside-diphosphate-sugar epimerase